MSVHHDTATVLVRDGWLAPDTTIEVLGYAYLNGTLMVAWRDDAGTIHDIPAAMLRMEPHLDFETTAA